MIEIKVQMSVGKILIVKRIGKIPIQQIGTMKEKKAEIIYGEYLQIHIIGYQPD